MLVTLTIFVPFGNIPMPRGDIGGNVLIVMWRRGTFARTSTFGLVIVPPFPLPSSPSDCIENPKRYKPNAQ
jgi:hypothetical protein